MGQKYSFTPTAAAAGGSQVSFSIQNKPAWATFSIATGQLTGTPTSANVGTYANVIISVSNGTATASLNGFTITVQAVPSQGAEANLSWTAPTTNTDGTAVSDLAGYTIKYGTSAVALNQSVSVSSPTTTSYSVQNLAAGTWYFAIMADTSEGSESALSNIVSTTLQ